MSHGSFWTRAGEREARRLERFLLTVAGFAVVGVLTVAAVAAWGVWTWIK